MTRPIKEKSVGGATGTEAGSRLETAGRITIGLFVVAANLDTGNDTLEVHLEASLDGTNWAPVEKLGGNKAKLVAADFTDNDGDGTFVGFLSAHGVAAQYVRARVVSFSDAASSDLSVDAWVSATNGERNAYDYRETGSV